MLAPAVLAISACQTVSTDVSCTALGPLTYNTAKDTKATVEGIKKHNSKWVCICEKDCPKRP